MAVISNGSILPHHVTDKDIHYIPKEKKKKSGIIFPLETIQNKTKKFAF